MNGHWLRVCSVVLVILLSSACSSSDENLILGEWYMSDGQGSVKFSSDGAVLWLLGKHAYSGQFEVLDDSKLRIEFDGLANLVGPNVFGYNLADDVLVLDYVSGKKAHTYIRQDPGPFPEIARQIDVAGRRDSLMLEAAFNTFRSANNRYPTSRREVCEHFGSTVCEHLFNARSVMLQSSGNQVLESIEIDDGRIVTTFSESAHPAIAGKSLILTPKERSHSETEFLCSSSTIEHKYLTKECGGQNAAVRFSQVPNLSEQQGT